MESRIEALLAGISFLFFLVHTATAGSRSFFKYALLKDRNFATGTCFIFIIGAVMYATRALLPPRLLLIRPPRHAPDTSLQHAALE